MKPLWTRFTASRKARTSWLLIPVGLLGALIFIQPQASSVNLAGPVASNSVEDYNEDPSDFQLWLQLTSFDASTQKATFNLFPWTDSLNQTFSSSMISQRDFTVFVDELYGKGFYEFRKGEVIGAVPFEADVLSLPNRGARDSDFYYPLDSYVLDAYVGISADGSVGNGLPAFEYFYETAIPELSVTYSRIAGWDHYETPRESASSQILSERKSGRISFLAKFERSGAVRFVALAFIFVFIINSVSLIWITIAVRARRRPPSLQVLVWSAASLLGYVQIRASLPGSPRLGIAMDYLFYFPALFIGTTVVFLMTISWSRRDDFTL